MVKKIMAGNDLIAIIIPKNYHKDGIEFFTPPDLSQQLGYMKRPKGYKVAAHTHNLVVREVKYTLETLVIRSGRISMAFYSKEKKYIGSEKLSAGDLVLLVSGGHGIAFLEESEVIEIKQGPYISFGVDKERFGNIHEEK